MPRNKIAFLLPILLCVGLSATLRADTDPNAVSASTETAQKKLTLQDLLKASSRSSSHSSSAVGVRGLEETGGQVDTQARNYVAIEKLELVTVSDAELQQFVKEGKLR